MAQLILANTSEPTTPASGKTKIFVDSTDKIAKQKDDGGVVKTLAGLIATLSAPVATVGAAENVLLTGTVKANSVKVGEVYRVKILGISSSTGTLIFRVRTGPAGAITDNQAWISITSAAQVANQRAGFEGLITVRSIGAGGTIQCEALGFAQAALLPTVVAAVTTAAVDTTADWLIDLDVTCSLGTFTAQQASIEKL